ncbi:hypothetical protein B0H67DRAFT_646442 [Lasiosphaeris hirsuta]|uniref:NADH dehydrogenase [ubiquinone] 1 alpha subcomplex subunit n=1 Tax=Lasiosphaeris hirsuta TaxID=260670 RepID=A0AA40A898_9PEZI|nr:hypothetical protein B0H67DRAFT_646442 [Lasiosphaeris hirsuta]
MSTNRISPFVKVWYKWKSLKLPWRRKFLAGHDLYGNTFWEFRIAGTTDPAGRWRRIVNMPSTTHYGDVKLSPAWHQWLRYTRWEPPSIEEQRADVIRQERMKVLAAEADARWAAKPGYVDAPGEVKAQPQPVLQQKSVPQEAPEEKVERTTENESTPAQPDETEAQATEGATLSREETWRKMQQQKPKPTEANPWVKTRGGPSEEWQPQAWQPPAAAPKKL